MKFKKMVLLISDNYQFSNLEIERRLELRPEVGRGGKRRGGWSGLGERRGDE